MSGRDIKKACDGKAAYTTETAVLYHISSSNKEGVEQHYKCRFCKNYHTATVQGMSKLVAKKASAFIKKREKKGPRKMKLHVKIKPGKKRKPFKE